MGKKSPPQNPASKTPTLDDPGVLPAEVAERSSLEKQKEKDQLDVLRIIRNELGASSATVTLRRRNPMFGQTQYQSLGVPLDAKDATTENIIRMFGGGDYIANFRDTNGAFERQVTFSLDHSVKPKSPLEERKEPAAPPQTDVAGIVRTIVEALPKPPPPPDNTGLFEIVKAMLAKPEPKQDTALFQQLIAFQQESERRMMKMIETITTTIANREPPKSFVEQMEEFKAMRELIGDGGAAEKPESFWKEIGKGAAEALGPIIKAHFAGGAAMAPIGAPLLAAAPIANTGAPPASLRQAAAPVTAAAAIEVNTTVPASPAPDAPDPMFNQMLGRFRSAAIEAARKNKDAYDFADSLLTMIPESYHSSIYAAANAQDWFHKIFGADLEAQKHIAFLAELRSSILAKCCIAHAKDSQVRGKAPIDAAREFLGWSDPAFHDSVFNMCDPENWREAFAGEAIDPAWLEQLRLAYNAQFEPAPSENVVAMPKAEATPAVTPKPTRAKK